MGLGHMNLLGMFTCESKWISEIYVGPGRLAESDHATISPTDQDMGRKSDGFEQVSSNRHKVPGGWGFGRRQVSSA